MGILLKSQYTVRYTNGEEFTTAEGRVYRGFYIYTVKGKMYAGNSTTTKGPQLFPITKDLIQGGGDEFIPYDTLKPKIYKSTHLRDPIATKPSPTKGDESRGIFVRYFFLDLRTKTFSETSKEEYQKRAEVDSNIYKFYKLGWWINSLYQERNSKELKTLEKLGNIALDIYEYASIGDDIPNNLDKSGY